MVEKGTAFFYTDKDGKPSDAAIHAPLLADEDAIDAELVRKGVLSPPVGLKLFTPEEKMAFDEWHKKYLEGGGT